jgi:SNF2 family DNA or RNA helicase
MTQTAEKIIDHSNIYPFKTRPYAHQAKAWDMSKEKDEFALFMEMGTGKTKVAIDSIAYLYDSGRINSVLIVAPKGVYMNWVTKEIPTHLPDHVRYIMAAWHAAPKKAEQEALDHVMSQSDDLRILVMNVEAFSTARGTKFADLFMTCGGRVAMVVDESTTIKNPGATRTKNVIKVGTAAKYRRILTGEPVTRSPLDLYSQCQFLNPHLLGFSSYYTFRNRYAIMIDAKSGNRTFKKIVGFRQLDELSGMLKRFSYRVKKSDCLDLPAKIYQYRHVELSPEQKQIYKQLSDSAIASLQGKALTVDNVLTEILRLHQITCGHFKSDDGTIVEVPNNRLSDLMDVLDEADDKVIIWATYVQDIKRIEAELAKVYGPESVVSYYGATSTDDRSDAVKRFQEDPSTRFFVGNPSTGGYGITLTAATMVVYYSNSYNLEHRIQSEDRAHRIGQTKSVNYVDLCVQGTIDEKIIKALRAKKNIAATVLGEDIASWLS